MPASEYTTTSGGLRLKGAKDAGIDKKRKKKRKAAVDEDVKTAVAVAAQEDGHVDSPTPITKDINGEDGDVVEISNIEPRRDVEETRAGKTESQLNFERMRNKRVSAGTNIAFQQPLIEMDSYSYIIENRKMGIKKHTKNE